MNSTLIELLESAKILAKAGENHMLAYLIEMAQLEGREATARAVELAKKVA